MFYFFSLSFWIAVIFQMSLPSSVIAVAEKRVLVIGCGRSGTTYMARVLKTAGLHVEHESMGGDGCVSWLMTPESAQWAPWGPLSKDYEFEHIFHQVRNPLKVIQSMYNTPPLASWTWVSNFIPMNSSDSNLTKCAKYWYYWNLLAEERAEWTYRIEDFDLIYDEMARRMDFAIYEDAVKAVSKKARTQFKSTHRIITWPILKAELDPGLFDKVYELAVRYGYDCILDE